MTTKGNQATIRIQNTNAPDTTMDIQIRGEPIVRNAPIDIITEDQDSIDLVGQPYSYPYDVPWLSSPATVKVIHEILLRIYAEPAERLTMTWEAESGQRTLASEP